MTYTVQTKPYDRTGATDHAAPWEAYLAGLTASDLSRVRGQLWRLARPSRVVDAHGVIFS